MHESRTREPTRIANLRKRLNRLECTKARLNSGDNTVDHRQLAALQSEQDIRRELQEFEQYGTVRKSDSTPASPAPPTTPAKMPTPVQTTISPTLSTDSRQSDARQPTQLEQLPFHTTPPGGMPELDAKPVAGCAVALENSRALSQPPVYVNERTEEEVEKEPTRIVNLRRRLARIVATRERMASGSGSPDTRQSQAIAAEGEIVWELQQWVKHRLVYPGKEKQRWIPPLALRELAEKTAECRSCSATPSPSHKAACTADHLQTPQQPTRLDFSPLSSMMGSTPTSLVGPATPMRTTPAVVARPANFMLPATPSVHDPSASPTCTHTTPYAPTIGSPLKEHKVHSGAGKLHALSGTAEFGLGSHMDQLGLSPGSTPGLLTPFSCEKGGPTTDFSAGDLRAMLTPTPSHGHSPTTLSQPPTPSGLHPDLMTPGGHNDNTQPEMVSQILANLSSSVEVAPGMLPNGQLLPDRVYRTPAGDKRTALSGDDPPRQAQFEVPMTPQKPTFGSPETPSLSPDYIPGTPISPSSLSHNTTAGFLRFTWTIWFDSTTGAKGKRPTEGGQYLKTLKPVGTFNTQAQFTHLWEQLKVQELSEGCNVRVFRQGIHPVWEDKHNAGGTKWLCRGFTPDRRSTNWTRVVMRAITGQLEDNTDHEICGIVLSTRRDGDGVQVWTDGGYFAQQQVRVSNEEKPLNTNPPMNEVLCNVFHDMSLDWKAYNTPDDVSAASPTTTSGRRGRQSPTVGDAAGRVFGGRSPTVGGRNPQQFGHGQQNFPVTNYHHQNKRWRHATVDGGLTVDDKENHPNHSVSPSSATAAGKRRSRRGQRGGRGTNHSNKQQQLQNESIIPTNIPTTEIPQPPQIPTTAC